MKYNNTPVGIIPETWEIKKISEITEIVTDYVANGSFASLAENVMYKDTEDIAVLIRLVDFNNNFNGDFVFIDEHAYEFLKKSKLYGGEIIISNVGANVGTVFKCPKLKYKMSLAPNSIMVKFHGCNEFYYQWLRGYNGQQMLKSIVTGSAQPKFNKTNFKEMFVPVPPIEIQKQIASILSVLDDKIEQNNQINENLESQAQAFFTDLFITNAKPEWKTGTVSDLGDVVGGGTPSKKVEEYYTNDGIAWITPKDLSNDKSKFITHGETDITDLGLAKSSATLMPRGSVLFSSRAPIGYIAIADGQVSTNQGFKSIVPFDNVGTAYVYYFLKENLSAIENVASGSTFKEVSGGTMKNFPAVIPDDDTLAKFKQFCSPLLEQQRALEYENRYLASLRDALLPKLMNGEIDVSKVKI